MPSSKEVKARYARTYREKARAAGLCDQCNKAKATIFNKCQACHQKAIAYRVAIRQQGLDHYGGQCVCCGESNPAFLAFDHIHNNGAAMRRSIPSTGGGAGLHYWLRRNGYPPDFQILCMNCNFAKAHHRGVCPHQVHSAVTFRGTLWGTEE